GSTPSWLIATSPPTAPQPSAATRYTTRRVRAIRTPRLRAPISSSRTAVSASPSRPRSSRYTVASAATATARPAQYVNAVSSVGDRPVRPGNDWPVPPPSDENRLMTSWHTSATTQVAIAKYPPRSRNTSHDTGRATAAQASAASGSAANGSTPCCANTRTKYAPSPTNACWPTDTSPA